MLHHAKISSIEDIPDGILSNRLKDYLERNDYSKVADLEDRPFQIIRFYLDLSEEGTIEYVEIEEGPGAEAFIRDE